MRIYSLLLAGFLSLSLVGTSTAQYQPAKPAQDAQEQSVKDTGESKSLLGRVFSRLLGTSKSTEDQGTEKDAVAPPATHQQVGLIQCADDQGTAQQVNSFCLDADDNILAGCGNGPGQIRVYNADGEFVRSWEVPIKPEAVNIAPDGTLLVVGDGKVYLFRSTGELIREGDSPHAQQLRENADQIREEIMEQARQMVDIYKRQTESFEQRIAKLKEQAEDEELSKADQRRLAAYERTLEQLKQVSDRQSPDQMSEAQLEQQVKAMTAQKLRISSISSDGSSIYLATRAQQGYGFDVWKLDPELEQGEKIVSGLRGCCGQMDVQACSQGVFVAENARHRVVSYDVNGEEVCNWGGRDRLGVDGFSSCCNPMNVAFGPNGDVYTAEATTGRIKRFTPEGRLVEYVGTVELIPGCKNVSIDVSSDGDRVYMLDITRNHIVMMQRKSDSADAPVAEVAHAKEAE